MFFCIFTTHASSIYLMCCEFLCFPSGRIRRCSHLRRADCRAGPIAHWIPTEGMCSTVVSRACTRIFSLCFEATACIFSNVLLPLHISCRIAGHARARSGSSRQFEARDARAARASDRLAAGVARCRLRTRCGKRISLASIQHCHQTETSIISLPKHTLCLVPSRTRFSFCSIHQSIFSSPSFHMSSSPSKISIFDMLTSSRFQAPALRCSANARQWRARWPSKR